MSSAIPSPPGAASSPSAPQEIAAANEAAYDSNSTSLHLRHSRLNPTGLTASSPEPPKTKEQLPTPANPHHHAITNAILSPPPGEFFINLLLQVAGIVAAIAFGVFAVESLRVAKDANTLATQAIEEAKVANQVAMLALCTQSTGNAPSFCDRVLDNEDIVLHSEVTALFTAQTSSTRTPASSVESVSPSTIVLPSVLPPLEGSTGAATASFIVPSTSQATSTNRPTAIATPPTSSASPAPASSGPSRGVIIGIAVPVGTIFMMILIIVTLFCIRRRQRPQIASQLNAPFPASEGLLHGTFGDQRPYDTAVPGKEGSSLESRPPEQGWRRWWNIYRALFMESRVSTSN